MAVVKLEALNQLAKQIRCTIPELSRVCIGQADPSRKEPDPSLSLIPAGKWTYEPHQALEVYDPAPDSVVMDVGYFSGSIEIRAGASNAYKRAELEQKLLDLFLSDPGRPGVLLSTVLSCPALGRFVAAWTLDDTEWISDFAFDSDFYSQISATGIIPALVTRRGVYTIRQLQLGLSQDFGASTDFSSSDIEVVQITENGTLQAA